MDPAEMLIRAMAGQQITVAAARTALSQLAAVGRPSRSPGEGLDRMFPTPAEIAGGGSAVLRGPQRRIAALLTAAAAMADGGLDFGYGDSPESLAGKLLPLPGVGPWTTGYMAMRVLGAPDVFLANDAAVRNGIRALAAEATTPTPDFREVSPWRSYATMHLWRAAAHAAAAQSASSPRRGTAAVRPRQNARPAEKANR
jgi:AraC family transcriptional regulator of adaptative response / DNA-3-methyladenine glycosylase II